MKIRVESENSLYLQNLKEKKREKIRLWVSLDSEKIQSEIGKVESEIFYK
jgi:hypothetical protein